MEPLRTRKDA
jgi:hypothetical protein